MTAVSVHIPLKVLKKNTNKETTCSVFLSGERESENV